MSSATHFASVCAQMTLMYHPCRANEYKHLLERRILQIFSHIAARGTHNMNVRCNQVAGSHQINHPLHTHTRDFGVA